MMKRICVFCGSAEGRRPVYRETATEMGRLIAARDMELIYGGGNVGLMGAVADAVLKAGGKVTGIIPYGLMRREVGHLEVTELKVVDSMHERKALMADMADGFVALPGGFGTFEELCEIVTWAQLGMHHKPCAVLNTAGYYDPLLAMVEHAHAEGFIQPIYKGLVLVGDTPTEILDKMEHFDPPKIDRWINRETT